ncbi:MAG: hypothetical protein NT038_10105 [Euryarchaeota archaeon]|nr:hypothetical protein [Euryarchaeota archaeon]
MQYYCNECKKTISLQEFSYSMNKHKRPLCTDHQRTNNICKTTKDLQDLVKNRHKDDVTNEATTQPSPQLKTIKDWIAADMETWDKTLNKKTDESFIIKVSDEQTKNSPKHTKK